MRLDRRRMARGQRGTALVLALIAVTVIGALGAAYLQLTSSLARRQTHSVDQLHAFYLAEAGLAESFQAVRMGRSGQIGAEANPAAFGMGLLWVDAFEQRDGSLRLDSTGLNGRGRSSLSLVVEPVEVALGFFADEDLVVDSVVLMDGWDSDGGAYTPVPDDLPSVTFSHEDFLHDNAELKVVVIGETFYDYAYREGDSFFYVDSVPLDPIVWTADARVYFDDKHAREDLERSAEAPDEPVKPIDPTGESTGGGALIGSNGNVTFNLPEGETASVWGDVRPGPGGTVTGLDAVAVSGSTDPRSITVDLPEVEVPVVALQPAIVHDGLLPLLIPQGTHGHQRIEVAPDAELVIRGPATVVIGELVLAPGANLELDTRSGEVSLFVTRRVDFQLGSTVTTSGDQPEETTMQVSSTTIDPAFPAVNLDASSRFYGTIYAPDTDVHIGSSFEIFGGVVARRLDVAQGARLHFDNAGFSGTPLPKIIGWRVIEVPTAVKGGGDPFRLLGVTHASQAPLSAAHDLGAVEMELDYIDLGGAARSYSGPESGFNWDSVESVVTVERVATRKKENDSGDPTTTGPGPDAEGDAEGSGPDTGTRADVAEDIASLDKKALKDVLLTKSPLSTSEINRLLDSGKLYGGDMNKVLEVQRPLEDALLERLVNDDASIGSNDLKDVLIKNSPLSDAMVGRLIADEGALSKGDRDKVLAVQ